MSDLALQVTGGRAAGTTIPVDGEITFGRDAADSGTLGDDPEISRRHARITRGANGGLVVEDLGSTNGTFVNGRRIGEPTPIGPGDSVELGGSKLEVHGPQPAAAEPLAAPDKPTKAGVPVVTPSGPPPQPVTSPLPGVGAGGTHRATAGSDGGGSGVRNAILGAIVGILIGGGIAAALVEGDSDDGTVERFSLVGQGFSTEALDERTQQREISIFMRTFAAPHGIREGHVDKYLDESSPPPQRVYDALYTFTAQNGDTLVLLAGGEATEPMGPDVFFAQTFEQWRVVDGTGLFEGARGEGTLTTSVQVAGRGPGSAPTGSNLVKHFEGTLELDAD